MLQLEHFHSKQSVEHMYSTFGICDTINKAQLTVNDLGLSYRTVNYWDSNQLLLGSRKNEKGWRKFSFIDFMWINIIQSLRVFGFSTDTIHKIKDLCTRPVSDEVLDTVRRKEKLVQPKENKPNFLTNVLADLVSCKNHLSLLYNAEGELSVLHLNATVNNMVRTTQVNPFLNYVSISLSEIYIKFLQNIDVAVIEKLDIFPVSLTRVTGDLRNNLVSSMIFNYGAEQVALSQQHYLEDHEFVRDCLRLLTTTVFKDYEVNYTGETG